MTVGCLFFGLMGLDSLRGSCVLGNSSISSAQLPSPPRGIRTPSAPQIGAEAELIPSCLRKAVYSAGINRD